MLVSIMLGRLKPEFSNGVLKYGDILIGRKSIVIYGVVFQSGDEIVGVGSVSEIIKRAWLIYSQEK